MFPGKHFSGTNVRPVRRPRLFSAIGPYVDTEAANLSAPVKGPRQQQLATGYVKITEGTMVSHAVTSIC